MRLTSREHFRTSRRLRRQLDSPAGGRLSISLIRSRSDLLIRLKILEIELFFWTRVRLFEMIRAVLPNIRSQKNKYL